MSEREIANGGSRWVSERMNQSRSVILRVIRRVGERVSERVRQQKKSRQIKKGALDDYMAACVSR